MHFWNFYQDFINRKKGSPSFSLSIFPKVHAISHQRMKEMMEEYKDYIEYKPQDDPCNTMTGIERTKKMWKDIVLGTAWEFQYIEGLMLTGAVVGFAYGLYFDSRAIVQEGTKRFNEMAFEGEFHARRKLIDYTMLQSVLNGFRGAWRIAIFPGYLACTTLSSMAYRNDIYPLDFSAATAAAAAFYKFPLGPRASLTAAGVMSIVGLMAGFALKGIFWLGDTSVSEFRYWNSIQSIRSQKQFSSNSWAVFQQKKDELEEIINARNESVKNIRDKQLSEYIQSSFIQEKSTTEENKSK